MQLNGLPILTDSGYMWWTATDPGPQEIAQVFTDSNTCLKYISFGTTVSSPASYITKGTCEYSS